MAILTLSLFLAEVSTSQMIVTTPIKLPTMMVTRLPFPFDQNELELWNVEFWWLRKLLWGVCKSDYIQSFLIVPMKYWKKKKKFDYKRKITFFLSPLLFNCNIEKNKIMICYPNFLQLISILVKDTTNPSQLFVQKCQFFI